MNQFKNNARCLFICTISPLNKSVKSGGANLTRANYQALSELCHVDVINSLSGKTSFASKVIRLFSAFWNDLAGNSCFFRKRLLKQLKAHSYDFVFIDHSQLGCLSALIRKISPKTKVIGAFQNIESEYIANSLNLPATFKRFLQSAAFQNEASLVKNADCLLSLTDEDSSQIYSLYGRKADLVIPITTETPAAGTELAKPIEGHFLLFCGSYFSPNAEAVNWFVSNVIDSLQTPLVVIGYQMEKLKPFISHPKLRIIGTVDNVAPYYQQATAVINPVSKGAGMNSKSVEAAGYGKKLYATSFALRGFPRPLPRGITVCNTAADFIENLRNDNASAESNKDIIEYHKNNFTLSRRVDGLSRFICR